ncbi:hypothetical protein LguiA_022297 [Lonicera macranthoides]
MVLMWSEPKLFSKEWSNILFLLPTTTSESPLLEACQVRRLCCTPLPLGEILRDASHSNCVDFLSGVKASTIAATFEAIVASCFFMFLCFGQGSQDAGVFRKMAKGVLRGCFLSFCFGVSF